MCQVCGAAFVEPAGARNCKHSGASERAVRMSWVKIWSWHMMVDGDKSKLRVREGSCYQSGWIFGKVPKGGGVIFNLKNYVADFGNRAFWAWNWYKKSKYRVQGMFFQQLYWEKSKQDTLSNLCLTCTVGALVKGTNDGTKTDEFSENFQTALDPSEWSLSLEIMSM